MRLLLFPTVQAPGEARSRLAELSGTVDESSLSDLRIVVSELLTISIAHGASRPIDLGLDFVDEEIEGVMEDHGPGARAVARARERRDDSLVINIIGSLVDEWGVDDDLTRIWFRMPVRRIGEARYAVAS